MKKLKTKISETKLGKNLLRTELELMKKEMKKKKGSRAKKEEENVKRGNDEPKL
jgi:hypothetical protein